MPYGLTTIIWKEGLKFCSKIGDQELTCDESGGKDRQHPSAPELLMMSLGACIGSVLVTYAARHELNLEGMKISLAWELAENPHRIGEIVIAVTIPAHLTEEQRATLTHVAHACLIHNTLTHPPRIELGIVEEKK